MKNDYLEHNFPVIFHAARPARLDAELRKKLNTFLPLYRDCLERVITLKGRTKKNYRFFKPHHMAVVILPSRFVLALDTTNASIFMTGFFCFELKQDVEDATIIQILEDIFHLHDSYLFSFDKILLSDDLQNHINLIYKMAMEYENKEYNLMKRKRLRLMEISPKVFSNKDIEVKENYCFVLMPFQEDLREIYEDCIKVATEKCGLICERADDIFHNQSIMEVIWTKICSAEIIIADLTGRNPNVFYEVGIAHTLGKEVILITQNEDDIPFDLRHIRYIKYGISKRGQEKLTTELTMMIQSIKGTLDVDLQKHIN